MIPKIINVCFFPNNLKLCSSTNISGARKTIKLKPGFFRAHIFVAAIKNRIIHLIYVLLDNLFRRSFIIIMLIISEGR